MDRNKKIIYSGLLILLVVLVVGIMFQNRQLKTEQQQDYQFPSPETVVRQYFTAWNAHNYPEMYATISDGFKKIDIRTKDLAAFRQFASSQGIERVMIKNITEISNDGTTAQVNYDIELVVGEGNEKNEKIDDTKPFRGTFTLKYRQGDVIHGWKLIHPYGEKIDIS